MERSQKEIASFRRLKNTCFTDLEEAHRMVLAEPALLHARSIAGETAMHWLAIENEMTAVTALLDWGAELDAVDDSDATPLLHCVTLGYNELIALLVARGACASHKSNTSQSPLSEAARKNRPEVLRLLLSSLHKKEDINPLFDDWDVKEIRDCGGETSQLLIERGLREKNPDYDF